MTYSREEVDRLLALRDELPHLASVYELFDQLTAARDLIDAQEAEIKRYKTAMAGFGKNPDECNDAEGCCVSHAAYQEVVETIEAAGWTWSDEADKWVAPAEEQQAQLTRERAVRRQLDEALEELRGNIGAASLVRAPEGIRLRIQADKALAASEELDKEVDDG